MTIRTILSAVCATALLGAAVAAHAQATITDSSTSFSVGVGPDGELFDSGTGVGFQRLSDGYDPLAPGTPRDSWGVSDVTTLTSAYGDYESFGVSNLTSTTQSFGANGGTSTSVTTFGLLVNQSYSFVSPNIVAITETVTNSTGAAAQVDFQRDIDWDVEPTEFNENTFGPTVSGSNPEVIDSSYDGFENPDPLAAYGSSCFSGCNNTADLGGGIKVDLGTLAAGASASITYFYGISEIGQSVNGLMSEAEGDGASYIIATQSSENGAYPALGAQSAFIAVGDLIPPSVPEPAAWALMILGLGGVGFALRRRKALAAV